MSGKCIPWTVERLARVCDREGECWLWPGYARDGTMPMMRYQGSCMHVRRAGVLMASRTVKRGTFILAKPDCNAACVNPAHALVLTGAQYQAALNSRNLINQPLQAAQVAAAVRRRAKLSPEVAAEIRRRRAAGEKRQDLAQEFGVGADQIWRVCAGVTWAAPEAAACSSVFTWGGGAT